MKQLISVAILLFCLFFSASSALSQSNKLLYNGGFEKKKTDNVPEGWEIKQYRGTSAEFAFDDVEKHSGNYSYRVKVNAPGGSFLLYPEHFIGNIKPGRIYQLSVWVKAKNLGYSPNFIAPAIRFNFRPDRIVPVPVIDLMFSMKGETEWKNLVLTGTAPPNSEVLTLDFLFTNGTVWLDDVEIREIKE